MKKLLVGVFALAFALPVFARSHGHHHREWRDNRGGHYVGGQGSSHRGGHYVNRLTENHYSHHRKW